MLESTPYLFTELREHLPTYTTGILPSQSIAELIAAGHITADPPVEPEQVQPSSLDLRIGAVAYRIRASFLSSRNARVIDKLQENHLYKLDLTRPAVLERGCAYIAPLMEEMNLPADISGKANPKSTSCSTAAHCYQSSILSSVGLRIRVVFEQAGMPIPLETVLSWGDGLRGAGAEQGTGSGTGRHYRR